MMKKTTADFRASDGKTIHVQSWSGAREPKAVALIVHGMCEYGARYQGFARLLCERGYAVYAPDHRGHGKTAQNADELGFLAEKGGFFRVVEDILELTAIIKRQLPGKEIVLFGHSMGSFIARACIAKRGADYSACVLSGTAGRGPYDLGRAIAALVILFTGKKRRTALLNDLAFDPYSKPFRPNRTRFDWLSRDQEEVDKYVSDPLCGFLCSNAFYRDLFFGLSWIHRKASMRAIPADLPLFLCSGSRDPVGGMSGAVEALAREYRAIGIIKVDCRIYPEARHELVNETNRDEVMRNFADWMDGALRPS
jgi:alpha-beta hydrolase superfamily lysophospholipase